MNPPPPDPSRQRTIAFVGLGSMGRPMARRLVETGHQVRGYDIALAARDAFTQDGGCAVSSVRDAASNADLLLLMVVNADQAETVLFSDDAASALRTGATVIASCTQPAARARACGQRLADQGLQFLDAPVSGGVAGATSGTLTIMAAGPTETFEGIKDLLATLGDKVHHVGTEWGQGSVVKTVNQLMCGCHIAVAAEALSLARSAGIDGRRALEILGASAAASWMLNDRGPRMLEDDPVVTSAVDIFVKDLGIVLDTARAERKATPIAALAHQLFLSASAQGLGRSDDSQLIRIYEKLGGGSE